MSLLTYATIYFWYKSPISRVLRYTIIIVAGFFAIHGLLLHTLPKVSLFTLSCLFMAEVTYWFKIRRTIPNLPVSENKSNVYTSFTFQALRSFFFTRTTKQAIQHVMDKKHVGFILRKSHMSAKEIPFIEIPKDDIARKAFALVKQLGGTFVTRMDLFVAYILLIEPQAKLLFNRHLKEEEFLHILYWARFEFPEEEHPAQHKQIMYWGEGLFDYWTTGWTLETKKYITDITAHVLSERPSLLGHKKQFQTMIAALGRPSKNNVLLIGDTGTGKTSLVYALALNSFLGLLSGTLYHQRIYELMIGALVAGIQDMGELETRLESIITEVAHAGNVILFIPELQNIVGSQSFHMDLTGALTPHLRAGKIRIIASVTPDAYKQYIEPQRSFTDTFEIIRVEEPDPDEAIQMLLEKANEIEDKYSVTLTYRAIVASVNLAHRFFQDRALPGSAVSLLTSVASEKAKGTVIEEEDIVAEVEQQTHGAIATPGEKEKNLLLHLEDELHKRIIGQDEAVRAIAQAIRRERSGLESQQRPISFLFLGPTGVGKTETAKALATVYFGGEDKIIRLDMSEYTGFDALNRLLGATAGEGNEKGELTEKVYEHPFSLILLDEFEKAHPDVLNLFLQVLEDGHLTDNKGKRISFANTIIIATSNAGAFYIQDKLHEGQDATDAFKKDLMAELQKEHVFKPELLNRFDGIIIFTPLTPEEIQQIAKLFLVQIQQKLAPQEINIQFDQSVMNAIVKQGFDVEYGARPLRRFIQDNIEDVIAKELLEGKVERGGKITVKADENGNISLVEG